METQHKLYHAILGVGERDKLRYSSGWMQTCYVTKDDFEFLISLPSSTGITSVCHHAWIMECQWSTPGLPTCYISSLPSELYLKAMEMLCFEVFLGKKKKFWIMHIKISFTHWYDEQTRNVIMGWCTVHWTRSWVLIFMFMSEIVFRELVSGDIKWIMVTPSANITFT